MGFFKKIFKGIKKVFKKIGKAIKKTFKKVGKFMGKIGIVGQLGMALIMPYALPALGGFLGTAATSMMNTTVGGFLGTAIKGAGHFLNAAVKVGTRVGQAFKSVTSAVTETVGKMVGATVNKIPGAGDFLKGLTGGKIDITDLGFDDAWKATQDAWGKVGSDLNNLFSKSTFDSSINEFTANKFKALDAEKMKNTYQNVEDDTYKKLMRGEYTVDQTTGGIVEKTQLEKVQSGIYTTDEAGTVKFKDDVSLLSDPAQQVSKAQSLGERAKGVLADQGVEMSLVGVGNLIDQYNQPELQDSYRDVRDPFAFVDMSALQTAPIQTSPGLATSNMMAGTGGYSDFNQIQEDILSSNFTNIYSQGYYGPPSLQAGLALAYEELAA